MNVLHRSCLLLLALALSLGAHADLTIEITQGADDATPIAVVPFKGSELDENIGTIVHDDLERSGVFNPVAIERMPSRPSFAGEVLYSEWKPLAADYLLVGSATAQADGSYEIRYELLSVSQGHRLLGESVTVPAGRWRDAAHLVSDHVFEKITGIKGAFSTHIVYVNQYRSKGKLRYRLERSDADGHRPVAILDSPEPILSPSWSPDGKKVAYVSFEEGKPSIFVQGVTTKERVKVADFNGLNGAPAFSPDGRRLALTLSRDGNPEIYIMNLASKALTRVTQNYAIDTEPRWMPDGQSLIFTSDRGGNAQVYRVNLASGDTTRLTFDGNFNARPDVSPDGRYIAVVHRERGQQFQIAVLDLKNGVMSTLTDTPLDESPSFAPNGAMLTYATRKGGQGVLGIISLDGRFKVRLPARDGEVREPAWSPFSD
jgi:TolB protein